MLNVQRVRNILESESDRRNGARKLVDVIHQGLGLMTIPDREGVAPQRFSRPKNFAVNRGHVLESAKQTIRPEDIRPHELAMAIFGGHDGAQVWSNFQDAARGYMGGRFPMHGTSQQPLHDALESGVRVDRGNGQVDVLEADTALVPSQFANISAFNAITAGLYEAKILEIYQRPEFIAQQLAKTEPSVRRAEKIVGVSLVGDVVEERKPGNAHKRATLSERFVTGPTTQNKAIAIDVTREAIMFDYSKQLMKQAEKVAEAMAMRREYQTIQTVLGAINTYTYDGTNYNTYATSGNWINKLAANTLTDWTNLNGVEKLLTQMVDQETGQPINVSARQILCLPAKLAIAEQVMRQTSIERVTAGVGVGGQGVNNAAGTGSFSERGYGPNPFNGRYELLPASIWVRRIAVASAGATNLPGDPIGLGLTDTIADQYWWMGDFHRAFQYSQQLPLTTIRVDANNYAMADSGLVFSIFLDEMGIPMVLDPRFVVLSTN